MSLLESTTAGPHSKAGLLAQDLGVMAPELTRTTAGRHKAESWCNSNCACTPDFLLWNMSVWMPGRRMTYAALQVQFAGMIKLAAAKIGCHQSPQREEWNI